MDFTPAMQYLRVCWKEQSAGNCGKCLKCIRTMSTINLFGQLDRFRTFEAAEFSLDMLANVEIPNANDAAFISEIADEAAKIGDTKSAAAASAALRKYTLLKPLKPVIAPLRSQFRLVARHIPYFWRFAR